MRVIILAISFLIFFQDCRNDWYRELPDQPKVEGIRNFVGVWKKKSNPRSAINSPWHKNEWVEKILFHPDLTFTKTYDSKDWVGNSLVERKVEGKGIYAVHGNWILLTTKQIQSTEKRDGQLYQNLSNNSESSLLYYYYIDKDLIIPMIYDMGYEEKNFGVKDGVKTAHDDANPNFFHYIKIYAFKEFQSHAYYPDK